jgi:hypothetical protein
MVAEMASLKGGPKREFVSTGAGDVSATAPPAL